MYGTVRYTFAPVTQKKTAKTFCTECGKKLKRIVSRQFYRNGFHDEAKTRQEHATEIDKEVKELEQKGIVCTNCENIANDAPIVKKKNKNEYEVFARKDNKLLGLVRRNPDSFCTWVKWLVVSPKVDRYGKNCKTLQDGVETVVKHYAKKTA
jgi:hypothetical protein